MDDSLAYLFGLEQFGIKFGLENITALVESLGHPERAFRTVHIAGTNGKGSVTAMVDAGLRAAGLRSARYTSPHLVDLRERFVVDGQSVAQDALVGGDDRGPRPDRRAPILRGAAGPADVLRSDDGDRLRAVSTGRRRHRGD